MRRKDALFAFGLAFLVPQPTARGVNRVRHKIVDQTNDAAQSKDETARCLELHDHRDVRPHRSSLDFYGVRRIMHKCYVGQLLRGIPLRNLSSSKYAVQL